MVVNVRLSRRIVGTLFILLLVGMVTAACGSGGPSAASSSSSTVSSTTQAVKSETGPTLTDLTSSVQGQITGTGPNDFGVGGVSKVTCVLPTTWRSGVRFKCFAYDFAYDEMGQYDGKVAPASGGAPQWSGQWSPR